jgi:hypothetical protein
MPPEHRASRAKLATPPSSPERRAFIRHPCRQDGACFSIQSEDMNPWPVTWYNLTTDGVNFEASRSFQEGEVLALELQPPLEGFRRRLFVRVMHTTAKADGQWVFGCRFVDKLTDYEMQTLL